MNLLQTNFPTRSVCIYQATQHRIPKNIFIAIAMKPHITILLPQHTFRHRISFQHLTISHAHTLFKGTLQKTNLKTRSECFNF
jgi:hypothetical protein